MAISKEELKNRSLLGLICTLFLILLVIGSPLGSKESAITIQGVVLDQNNIPVVKLPFILYSNDETVKPKKIFTSATGRFQFEYDISKVTRGKKNKLLLKIGSSGNTITLAQGKTNYWVTIKKNASGDFKYTYGATLSNRIEVTGNFSIIASANDAPFKNGFSYIASRKNGAFTVREIDLNGYLTATDIPLIIDFGKKGIIGTISGRPVSVSNEGEIFLDGNSFGSISFFSDYLKSKSDFEIDTIDARENTSGTYRISVDKNGNTPARSRQSAPSTVSTADLEMYSIGGFSYGEDGSVYNAKNIKVGNIRRAVSINPATTLPPIPTALPPTFVAEYPTAVPNATPTIELAPTAEAPRINPGVDSPENSPTNSGDTFAGVSIPRWNAATPLAELTVMPEGSPTVSVRRTPLPLFTPGQPFLTSCAAIKNVTVKCVTAKRLSDACGEGAGACANKSDGGIFLPKESCEMFHLCSSNASSGDYNCTVTPSEFSQKTQCQGKIAQGDSGGGIDDCCMIRHEFGHLCDPDEGSRPENKTGCTETIAENMEDTCQQDTTNYYCGGTTPRWNNANDSTYAHDSRCENACSLALFRAQTKIWDACMCNHAANSPKGVTGDQCCSCVKESSDSQRVLDLLPSSCRTYYPDANSIVGASDYTSSQFPFGAHGCEYYGTDLGKACASTPTPVPTPQNTATATATATDVPTATKTKTPLPTITPTPANTPTPKDTPEYTEGKPVLMM